MPKASTIKKPTVMVCSPLKRKPLRHHNEYILPIVSRNFKTSAGLRKIVGRYHQQMESEVTTLKRRYLESRQSYKEIKREMREQREKTRQIITVCGGKLQEKENQVLKIRSQRDEELAKIARELVFLQSNMLKERKRLETIVSDQAIKIQSQEMEIQRLRKKLSSISYRRASVETPTSDMDTHTSSEDSSSPKSSFNAKPLPPKTIPISPAPPALPPRMTTNGGSASNNNVIINNKPPIPSRAGVNRKLALNNNNKLSLKLEEENTVFDGSGNQPHHHLLITGDEGFCSSHEDAQNNNHQIRNGSILSPSRQCTNHRGVQKPSDIKYRSKLRSVSNLGALEEHQVISNNDDTTSPVTTITYLDYF